MVKQAYGIAGSDLRIGAEILARAALDDEFGSASGQYFDNDSGRFAPLIRMLSTSENRKRSSMESRQS